MAGILATKISGNGLRGFSLIEVLVALFIQAFGLLGMTALQIKALKSTQAALIDSQVQFLLADMAERIRVNNNPAYEISFTDDAPAMGKDCEAVICSSNDLVTWDLRQWRSKIENPAYLPEGESQILFDNLSRTYAISIRYTWSQLGDVALIGEKRTVAITTSMQE
jgi:type IV pilus assembly protein PilV